jgi:hypothetical protein
LSILKVLLPAVENSLQDVTLTMILLICRTRT